MKTTNLIIGLAVGLMGPALAQTHQPATPSAVTNKTSSDTLVTKRGMVYQKYHIDKVDPLGLTISYVPSGGGLGMEKVPFDALSDDWQRRYGYDPEKAAKFELEQKQAAARLRDQLLAAEKAYREKRAQQEAAETAEQAKNDAKAVKTESPAATQPTNSPAMTNTNPPAPPSPRRLY